MRRLLLACALLTFFPGCLKKLALTSVANSLSASGNGGGFSREEDPELVRDSLPVIIELMRQIHESLPDHRQLTVALAQAVTSYSAGFLGEEADRLEEKDVTAAQPIRRRAKKLFLRGREFGLDALDHAVGGLRAALLTGTREQRAQLLLRTGKQDVPALYWTAAAWGSAIAGSKDDMELVGQLPQVAMLMQRALDLDESWDDGSIHEFFITYDMSSGGAGVVKAKEHFARALQLSHEKKLAAYVTYAEAVDIQTQDKKDFTKQLDKVIAFDVETDPDHRLVNVLAQRRAKWLLSRTADLFAE